MPTPEETRGDCVALAPRWATCASLNEWLPPGTGRKAPPLRKFAATPGMPMRDLFAEKQ